MNQIFKKPVANLVIGAVVGAVVVGGVWYTTYMTKEHGGVIAKVGDTPIKSADFLQKTESAAGSQTLNQLITEQLVEYGAKKYNVTAGQSEIDAELQNIKQQNNITSDAQLQQALSASNMTMADLNNSLRMQVLEKKLSERGVTVSDKEIQDYYDQNKSQLAAGGKTPPLSAVKSQIKDMIMQSKAVPPAQLLANLAKEDKIQILDTQYADVKTKIENPAPASPIGQ